MTEQTGSDRALLQEIRQRCIDLGFLEGMDFHVHGFPALLSSEYIELRPAATGYEVLGCDLGQEGPISSFADINEAGRSFIRMTSVLAGVRNRGPRAGRSDQVTSWSTTMTEEEAMARFVEERDLRRDAGT